MADIKLEQEKALNEIGDVLDVPLVGSPLSANRKWMQPRPDKKALEDFPGEKEQQDRWKEEWTTEIACNMPQTNQPSGKSEQKIKGE